MANNTDNEAVEEPVNTQAENLQTDIISPKDTEAITPIQKIETMEVHHPHHPSHKRKWTEYLLEFFMLFLAVFLGFVAENIRENYVERHREKEYMESLIKDIKADTANAGVVIRDFSNRQSYIDTVVSNFGAMLQGNAQVYAKYRLRAYGSFADFNPSDGTMQQLKNAGGLRLIRKQNVVDSILQYDATIKLITIESNHVANNKYAGLWNNEGSYINFYKVDTLRTRYGANWFEHAGDLFSTTDLQKRLELYDRLRYLQSAATPYLPLLNRYRSQGTRLIELLRKEYHLEDD